MCMSRRNNIFPSCVCVATHRSICRKSTKDKRLHPRWRTFLPLHEDRVDTKWIKRLLMTMMAVERIGFLLVCRFLKYSARKYSELFKKLCHSALILNSLKINYFPCCLSFYHLQVGCYVLACSREDGSHRGQNVHPHPAELRRHRSWNHHVYLDFMQGHFTYILFINIKGVKSSVLLTRRHLCFLW